MRHMTQQIVRDILDYDADTAARLAAEKDVNYRRLKATASESI